MGEMMITLPNGLELPFVQVMAMGRVIQELGHSHWHVNECGCCVTVHGRDCAYVIGPDGGSTFYAERGCACPDPDDNGTGPA
jgi:hypothetical protein